MSFSEATLNVVWAKGQAVLGADSSQWRKDACGAWIYRTKYGDRTNAYGWEVDHIKPIARGGGEELSNLRPLQWQNNAHKQEGRLGCAVTADGDHNVLARKERVL